jgi:acyl transferase domain-containing protein
VVEEYISKKEEAYPPDVSPKTPSLFVLSAKSEEQLKSYAQEMKRWIQTHEELALIDMAFTLQVGRAAMEYRLAIEADSREVLLQRLEEFVDKQVSRGVYTGQVKRGTNDAMLFEADEDGQSLLYIWLQKKQLKKLAQVWVRGVNIDWMLLYSTGSGQARGKGAIPLSTPTAPVLPYRISLPTYPFAREGYWIPAHHSRGAKKSSTPTSSVNIAEPDKLLAFTISYLVNILSTDLKISPEKLDPQVGFDEYGLDSIIVQRLHALLQEVFGPIPSTTFFQYKCVKDLAHYFLKEHEQTMHALFQQSVVGAESGACRVGACPRPDPTSPCPSQTTGRKAPTTVDASTVEAGLAPALEQNLVTDQDVAIIGISGQYPQAESLDAFWSNLESGRDCIVEIPQERWDYHTYYKPQNGTSGKTRGMYCKWGGFLQDVDKFDPSFFHISPLEARFMDPQERLFLQTVSACFEDAGYSKHLLRDESAGDGRANVGVFAGVTYNNYQLYLLKEYEKGNFVPINSQTYSIANRVSYIYNLRGPSLSIDTACSSSLAAIHLACESIKRGECAMAIAGGVNLSLHPSKYISLCATQFASSDGHCRSFGQDGDGYVPGEGVGAVLLKPLRDAIADGDHIYAVIKGTAVNNDGKTFGYSVPNPVAQTEVIRKALEVAHVDPRTISYVEAHGTGTKLGDPIEITGLSDAFKEYTSAKQYCAIGSVKSNIGHLEAAAGIAQVTKVVLQMKHKKLVPSLLHTTRLNPHIDFANTPFFVQQTLEEWKQPVLQVNGEEVVYPRRAGISSFGAGGVNVHVIIEDSQTKADKSIQSARDQEPVIIVLSAKKEDNLRDYTQLLKDYVEQSMKGPGKMATLKDLAYTLQTGRDPMPCRLAFRARDPEEILKKLEIFLKQRAADEKNGVYVGHSTAEKKPTTEEALDDLATVRSSPVMVEKMAELWASGKEIDWESLYQDERCLRVPLPTYPFSKERYWVGDGLLEPSTEFLQTEQTPQLAPIGPAPAQEEEDEKPRQPEISPFLAELCQALEGERQGMIETYMQDLLARLLAFNPPDVPELHQGFFDMGMESVIAEQFRVSLEETFLPDIPDTAAFDYPNISELSEYIVKRIPFSEIEKQHSPSTEKQGEAVLLDDIDKSAEDGLQELHLVNLEEVAYELSTLLDELEHNTLFS